MGCCGGRGRRSGLSSRLSAESTVEVLADESAEADCIRLYLVLEFFEEGEASLNLEWELVHDWQTDASVRA